MGLFGRKYPYSNFHELNLDWIIEQLKELEESTVLSVNGETGEVVLYRDPNVVFPEVDSNNWTITRTAGGHEIGIQLQANQLFIRYDGATNQVYTHDSPPPYPVTSVDGMTGAVTTMPNAATRLPDVTENYTNIRRQINTGTPDQAIVGIQVEKDKAYRMQDQQRLQLYDSANQPPYPVTSVNGRGGEVTGLYDADNPPPYPVSSVNGKTGTVMIAIPFTELSQADAMWIASQASPGNTAGMVRGTAAGPVSLWLDGSLDPVSGDHIAAYISWTDPNDDTNVVTQKLLTNADIPQGAGVISINGLTGVVTLAANNILYNTTDTIKDKFDDVDVVLDNLQSSLGIVLNGNTTSVAVAKGQYVIVENSTITGITDGLYTAAAAWDAGFTVTAAYLTAVPNGGLNALNSNFSKTDDSIGIRSPNNKILVIGDDSAVTLRNSNAIQSYISNVVQSAWGSSLTFTYHNSTGHGLLLIGGYLYMVWFASTSDISVLGITATKVFSKNGSDSVTFGYTNESGSDVTITRNGKSITVTLRGSNTITWLGST